MQSAFHRAIRSRNRIRSLGVDVSSGAPSGAWPGLYAGAMRLSGVMLFVKDFPRMRRFYAEMLRREPDFTSTDSYASYPVDGVAFALHGIPEEIARGIETSPSPRESSAVKFTLSTSNIPAERTRLESLGAAILQRSWQNPDEAFDAADPEGNVFAVSKA